MKSKKQSTMPFSTEGLELPLSSKPQPWNPEPWRLIGVEFLIAHASAGLLLDPGMGKTSMTYAAFSVLKKNKVAERMLVVPPLRPMTMVWPQERDKWEDFGHLKIVTLHGEDKEENLYKKADVYLINPEGLPWLFSEKRYRIIDADILCIDELSKFKHTNTQRFRTLKPFLRYFRRRWGNTGSPNPNGYLDLFGQCYVLDMGNALGPYITHYRNKYFYPSGYGGYEWKLQKGADKLIQKAIKPLMLRMEAEDYIKIPQKIVDPIRFELPKDARKIYEEMEDEMLVSFPDDETVTAINAAAASNKCSQIANGGVYKEDFYRSGKREVIEVHEEKNKALADLVAELQGSPLLVAYEFEHDLWRMQKLFGKDLPYIGGGVSTKRALELEKRWNLGEIPVLAGQPQSIGHGLNLQQAGNHICFYSTPWDYELYDQFGRRVRRSGNQHGAVFEHHLIARDTVDEAKFAASKRKGNAAKKFLDAMKDYRKQVRTRRQLPALPKWKFENLVAVNDSDIPF